ncbi:TPA: LOW QUALITY PROTEIN: hypothetical protein N0F65_004928 [Lagenidium giganteum]|uniref:5'-nucleotidase n=1 Tax=Lagenidium giganteum TaxID=4803 RepID=A0AAV2YW21_9STRA|nr:TPA: LOW QUALITY PROTEIN: hypothetical protein N0F65_004928 [Lagenidium giganteum]
MERSGTSSSTQLVVLTLNDVYELFPNVNQVEGVAEMATMLRSVKATLPPEAHVLVTLNGDFLWRCVYDRRDKGVHMVDVVNALGIDFVVVGNHDFDFGSHATEECLKRAAFTTFGSNVRQQDTHQIMSGLTDTAVVNLPNGLRLGLFGVSTTETNKEDNIGADLVVESEIAHAQRCVQQLTDHGVDCVVALTHLTEAEDRVLARTVPGIDVILGGHDHEPMTFFEGSTLVHKSGQDALWLRRIDMIVTKKDRSALSIEPPTFQWQMMRNHGLAPDRQCLELLQAYDAKVAEEDKELGLMECLAITKTLLDGSRHSCRTQECNLGNLVADALRLELGADVGLINGGCIKGETLHPAGLELTKRWLHGILPIPNPIVVSETMYPAGLELTKRWLLGVLPFPNYTVMLRMRAGDLRTVIEALLDHYPTQTTSHPHVSGLHIVFDTTTTPRHKIAAFRRQLEPWSPSQCDIDDNEMLTVATSSYLMSGVRCCQAVFANAEVVRDDALMIDLVESFLRKQKEVAYAANEGRIIYKECRVKMEHPAQQAHVVVLTLNDVYELFPNASQVGGVAEMATLLRTVRATLPPEAHVLVTLNGDFLWRSKYDRRDKGAHMVDVLNALGIDVVVIGNHDFDFGQRTTQECLERAAFTTLGSNVRQKATGQIMSGLTDTAVVNLPNGLQLGLFGVLTTETNKEGNIGADLVVESEIAHAQRCVQQLTDHGVDCVVALTHLKAAEDRVLARTVPGIDVILGGHDHEPMTFFEGSTLVHKSGQDALWLRRIDMIVTKKDRSALSIEPPTFQWQMMRNHGLAPDRQCLELLQAYDAKVAEEDKELGLMECLAITKTLLDGSRHSCRTQECNLGNLVADALRLELGADVGLINGGCIKGETLHPAGLELTKRWLHGILPIPNPIVVLRIPAFHLRAALEALLDHYPAQNAAHPHVSGLHVVFDLGTPPRHEITAFRRQIEPWSPSQDNIDDNEVLTVATSKLVMAGVPCCQAAFAHAEVIRDDALMTGIVESFLRKRGQVAYAANEGRVIYKE